jgi:hypothetical protein
MRIFAVIIVAITLGVKSFALPSSEDLWNNLHFMHLTNFIANNTVIPGAALIVKPSNNDYVLYGDYYDEYQKVDKTLNSEFNFHIEKSGDDYQIFDIYDAFPQTRTTSHWTVGTPVEDSSFSGVNGKTDWSQQKIGIIEPAKYFKEQLYGGNHNDMFVIGPHVLSHEAIVFVPQSLLAQFKKDNPSFRGLIKVYSKSPSAREAIKNYLKQERGPWTIDAIPDFSPKNLSLDAKVNEEVQVFLWAHRLVKLPASLGATNELKKLLSMGIAKKKEAFNALGKILNEPELLQAQLEELDEIERLCKNCYRPFLIEISDKDPVISVNGQLSYGRDFFSAWIKDGFKWENHTYSRLRNLELKLKELYKSSDLKQSNLIFELLDAKNEKNEIISHYSSVLPKYGRLAYVSDKEFDSYSPEKFSEKDFLISHEEKAQVLKQIEDISQDCSLPMAKSYLKQFIARTKRSLDLENQERIIHFRKFFGLK